MKYGSVCSGIEAATCAWHPLGWEPVFFSEIDKTASRFLAAKYPHVPNLGDMNRFQEWPDHAIDLLVGGMPCQSFSVAGLRKGLADPRGNLMLTYLAIADRYRPKWLVWENVPGVLSSGGGRDFGALLGGLAELGYGFAYAVRDAQYVRVESHPRAVPQRRRRVFVVGCAGGQWQRAAAVLFERESLSGHPPPRRETGEGVAPTIASRPTGGGGLGTDFDCDGGLIAAPTVSPALKARDSKGPSSDGDGDGAPLVVHSLRASGFDASEDGTGRGVPPVPVKTGFQGDTLITPNQSWPSLSATGGNNGGGGGASLMQPIAFPWQQGGSLNMSGSLIKNQTMAVAYGFQPRIPRNGRGNTGEIAGTLSANAGTSGSGDGSPHVAIRDRTWAVRRLTPLECTRLQGFPEYKTTLYVKPCSSDHQKNSAPAETQSPKSPRSVTPANAGELRPRVHLVELSSSTSHQGPVPRAALHVLINSGREEVRISRAGKSIWSASAAEKPSASAPLMPIGDFVRLAVAMTRIAARITRTGRAAPPQHTKYSTHPESGRWHVEMSGYETTLLASGAGPSTSADSDRLMSITSPDGPNGQSLEQTATTLFYSAVGAIASFIPEAIRNDLSSGMLIDIEEGYFDLPLNKPLADGNIYKLLGNSMAVNVMRWIGERIDSVRSIAP